MNELAVVSSEIDFSQLHERMQWYVDQEILPCCVTLVLRGADVIDVATYGYMDLENQRPLQSNAIFRMYSNTKIISTVAAMMLFEEGCFELDDPVAKFIPALADMQVLRKGAISPDEVEPARDPITMRHILSHTAGLSYGFVEPDSVVDQSYMAAGIVGNMEQTLEQLCNALGDLPLAYHPGAEWRYSYATDVVARVTEVISGARFDEFLKDRLLGPLGVVDTGFYVPVEKQDRFTTMYSPMDVTEPMKGGLIKADDPREGSYSQPKTWLSGGGGLVSTVADYVTLLRVLINGGEWQGTRLLQPETVSLMRANQLAEGVYVQASTLSMPGTGFGLGLAIKVTLEGDEPESAIDEYHWGGFAGTHTWMAPRAGIAGVCFTQLMPGFWHPFSHDFKRMVYERLG